MTEADRASPDSQHSVQGPVRAPSQVLVLGDSVMGVMDSSQSGRATVPPRLPSEMRRDMMDAQHHVVPGHVGIVSDGDEPRYVVPTVASTVALYRSVHLYGVGHTLHTRTLATMQHT